MSSIVKHVVPGDWSTEKGKGKPRQQFNYKMSREEKKNRDTRLRMQPGRAESLGSTILDETLG